MKPVIKNLFFNVSAKLNSLSLIFQSVHNQSRWIDEFPWTQKRSLINSVLANNILMFPRTLVKPEQKSLVPHQKIRKIDLLRILNLSRL